MSVREIRSVGIDIGTTTTQVIFSALELVNRASPSQVPRYEFSRRDITYESPVVFTPVDHEGRIDQARLTEFIDSQYEAADLTRAAVESGAIIITGETSKARNARATVMELAESLGDFVVATAGPHLESVIAGQGSGAGEYSRVHSARVMNIDVGGGTSNYVVFDCGRVVDTACLNVGGHLIETDANGCVVFMHEPAAQVVVELGLGARDKDLSRDDLDAIAARMAALVVEVIEGAPSALAHQLLMTDCLRRGHHLDALFISGGVGECLYHPVGAPFAYGDIGPLLAAALRAHPGFSTMPLREPKQTLRATVIGAGAYTLSLSGSTIWLNYGELPLRNIPVVIPALGEADGSDAEELSAAWEIAVRRQDLDPSREPCALALPPGLPVTYSTVLACAEALRGFAARHANSELPLIVIAKQDFGKALGMELQPALAGRALAVIDEVEVHEGDYVDIGNSYFGGEIVPLTVKSLAFPA
jgi:ethanolamine utilization protein EutA